MSKMLAIIGGALTLTGYILYNSQILFGNSKPSIAAWAVFGFLAILNVGSYLTMSKDWVMTLLPAASGLACLATTAVVIAKGGGFGTLSLTDKIVLATGIVASLVWLVFKKADYANVIVVAAVTIGFVPIYVVIYAGTVHEASLAWFIWTASYAIGGVVVILRWREEPEKKNRLQMVYPVAYVLLHGSVALMAI